MQGVITHWPRTKASRNQEYIAARGEGVLNWQYTTLKLKMQSHMTIHAV